jgi:hypothetical protein
MNFIQNVFCVLLFRLSPYADEISVGHQCAFRHNILTTDQIFRICQLVEKKEECGYCSISAILEENLHLS